MKSNEKYCKKCGEEVYHIPMAMNRQTGLWDPEEKNFIIDSDGRPICDGCYLREKNKISREEMEEELTLEGEE
jgi:hypothetical protein